MEEGLGTRGPVWKRPRLVHQESVYVCVPNSLGPLEFNLTLPLGESIIHCRECTHQSECGSKNQQGIRHERFLDLTSNPSFFFFFSESGNHDAHIWCSPFLLEDHADIQIVSPLLSPGVSNSKSTCHFSHSQYVKRF